MRISAYNVLTTVALALALGLAAGAAQAAYPSSQHGQFQPAQLDVQNARPDCAKHGTDASNGDDGQLLSRHLIRDGEGCIIWS